MRPADDPAAPAARLLALDTSTEQMAVAVVDGGRVWAANEAGGAHASQRLLPLVFESLARAGLELGALDAVAFGRGPGAFTGLRSACAVTQGLALGAGLPVLAIDSLAIVADDARAQQGSAAESLWVAIDARMDGIYAAAYRWVGEGWQTTRAPALVSPEALQQAWRDEAPACVAGSALAAFGERLDCGDALRVPELADRAAALARLALAAWRRGAWTDAALALPLYLREKVASTTLEREAAKAAR